MRKAPKTVRVSDDLWDRFTAETKARGTNASEALRSFIEGYVAPKGASSDPGTFEGRMFMALLGLALDVPEERAGLLWEHIRYVKIPPTTGALMAALRSAAEDAQAGRVPETRRAMPSARDVPNTPA